MLAPRSLLTSGRRRQCDCLVGRGRDCTERTNSVCNETLLQHVCMQVRVTTRGEDEMETGRRKGRDGKSGDKSDERNGTVGKYGDR